MKSFALVAALPMASSHGMPNFNISGADCPEGQEGGQACQLKNLLPYLSSSLGCPGSVPQLCDVISQTVDALNGHSTPALADQRYLVESLLIPLGYSKTFYGKSEQCCSDGDRSCCSHSRANYPGPEAQSYLTSTEIAQKMTSVPSSQKSGKITRRNMLGYLVLNDMFWYDLPEGEQGLGLGAASVETHSFVRPKLDRVFGSWDATSIERSVVDFLNGKSQVSFQNDPKVWTQQVLHRVVYDMDISEQEAQDFIDFQAKVLPLVILPQFIVDAARSTGGGEDLLKSKIGFFEVQDKKEQYLKRFLPIIKARHCQDCNDQQAGIVNSNLLDGLIFAGGLSVPGVIAPGVGVLHAGDQSPAPGMQVNAGNAQVFAWEAARMFPPVLGFPYVDNSQQHPLQIMNLGMGQRSGKEWGDDAEKPTFRLRDMQTYQKWWVGHADHAEDPSGEMTRRCPGKTLSMVMITAWFKAWDQARWAPVANTRFKFNDMVLFVKDFTMQRVARDDDMVV